MIFHASKIYLVGNSWLPSEVTYHFYLTLLNFFSVDYVNNIDLILLRDVEALVAKTDDWFRYLTKRLILYIHPHFSVISVERDYHVDIFVLWLILLMRFEYESVGADETSHRLLLQRPLKDLDSLFVPDLE